MSVTERATALRRRLDLSVTGIVAVCSAVVAFALAAAVLGKAAEDVLARNGLELTDRSHLMFFVDHRSTALVSAARMLSFIGSVPVLAILAVVAAGLLWWRGQRLVVATAPAVALLVAGTIAGVTKVAVDRARPPVALRLAHETEMSFPSGHATDSAALFLTLGLIVAVCVVSVPWKRVAVVVAAGALTFAIGLSRLVLGVHWPSDVIAGWALGTMVALAVSTIACLAARLTPDANQPTRPLTRAVARVRTVALHQRHRPLARLS